MKNIQKVARHKRKADSCELGIWSIGHVPTFISDMTEQDNCTAISPVNTLPASIFTWLTPFTGQGMNKSHLVYSPGSLTKKRIST